MVKKKILLTIFTSIIFSIFMLLQINIDTATTDFKVGGIISSSCAESANNNWRSCNDAMGTGSFRQIMCSSCSFANGPRERNPNLCHNDDLIED